MRTLELNKKAPYFFNDISVAVKKNGELRQSKKLYNIVRNNFSDLGNNCTRNVYYLRVDSFQFRRKGTLCVIEAFITSAGRISIKFIE